MYDNLKKLINGMSHSDKISLLNFLESVKKSNSTEIQIAAVCLYKYNKLSKKLESHEKKRVNHIRWQKKYTEIVEQLRNHLCRATSYINAAHTFQITLLRLLYVVENKENEPNLTFSNAPTSLLALVGSISFLDTTDKERIKVFNGLRNILAHTSIGIIAGLIDNKETEELSELCCGINEMNNLVLSSKATEILEIIENELDILEVA